MYRAQQPMYWRESSDRIFMHKMMHAMNGIRSMPCPVITVGFRQELLAPRVGESSSRVAVSFRETRGWLSTLPRCPALINPDSLYLVPQCIRPSRRLCIAMCQVYAGV
jgi:hypothetical protein